MKITENVLSYIPNSYISHISYILHISYIPQRLHCTNSSMNHYLNEIGKLKLADITRVFENKTLWIKQIIDL